MRHDHISNKLSFEIGQNTLDPSRGPNPGLQTRIPFDLFNIYRSSVGKVAKFWLNIDT